MKLNSVGLIGKLCIGAIFLLGTALPSSAVEKKEADVVVKNNTGKTILQVTVAHKYSDEYQHQLDWMGILKNGETTNGKAVAYNTGFGTTGRDWWYVSWVYSDSATIYYSDPNNFRGAMDFMEKAAMVGVPVAGTIAAGAIGAVCTVASGGVCGPEAAIAVASAAATAASAIASAAAGELLSSGGTAGFKQHILRDEDAGQKVTITLEKNNRIVISSPSGVSETVYSTRPTEVPESKRQDIMAQIDAFKKTKMPDLTGVWKTKQVGDLDFGTNTYFNGRKFVKINSFGWDEARQAVVATGQYGLSNTSQIDPKENGSFTWYFTDRCHFSGTYMSMVPEIVINTKTNLPEIRTYPWNGEDPTCR